MEPLVDSLAPSRRKLPIVLLIRVLITVVAVIIAIGIARRLWVYYEVEPWTRDGRVKAYVVQIAPDVSGIVTKVAVHDNQVVQAGDALFDIDPERFALSVQQAEATVQSQRAALAQATRDAQRNRELANLVSQEVREQSSTRVDQARAQLAQAEAALNTAKLNLRRTHVVAPVNGIVTNLDLLTPGGYVTAGRATLALVDSDSFYVEGYFEETKLPGIQIGDKVAVKLMGGGATIDGHIDSIASGIADRDRAVGNNLLPNVNPTFNWVRLAQRIPVRVALDYVPANVRLVSGQTATVVVTEAQQRASNVGSNSASGSTVNSAVNSPNNAPSSQPSHPPINR